MKSAIKIMAIAAIAATAAGTAALAHHSYAAFDRTKTVTVTGVLTDVEWTNPHTWVFLMVSDASGKMERWAVEGDPPGGMQKVGWKKTSANPGDTITVTVNPMVTGQLGGHYVSAVLPGGVKVNRGGAVGAP